MTTRKNYNSIVFLTTLSVYFGLVLVGVPASQVLAQTTPDKIDKTQIIIGNDIYGNALFQLASQLEKLSKEGKYNWSEPIDLQYQFRYFEKGKESAFICGGKRLKDISQIIDKTAESISRNLSEFENISSRRDDVFLSPFAVSVSINQTGITVKASRSDKENVDIFRNHFEQEAIAIENKPIAKIYENTKVTSENNQVFIVTRLPRGSLDALLTDKSAK